MRIMYLCSSFDVAISVVSVVRMMILFSRNIHSWITNNEHRSSRIQIKNHSVRSRIRIKKHQVQFIWDWVRIMSWKGVLYYFEFIHTMTNKASKMFRRKRSSRGGSRMESSGVPTGVSSPMECSGEFKSNINPLTYSDIPWSYYLPQSESGGSDGDCSELIPSGRLTSFFRIVWS